MQIKTHVLVALVSVSFLGGSMVSSALTQQQSPPVYHVNFMKTQPGKAGDYVRLEREIWKPIHQELVRTGRMHSWAVYAVEYPYGTAHEYDFVTIDAHASLADAHRSIDDVVGQVHPSLTFEEIDSQTEGTRSLVRGEVWRLLEQVP
jgi:hypothetical protein